MKAKIVLPANAKNVGIARDWAFENCRQFGIRGRRVMDIKTITSEIVTNVVRHAYTKGQKKHFVLTIKLSSDKLTLKVKDSGSGYSYRHGHSLHVGLMIVKALADSVTVRSFGMGTRVKAVICLKETEIRKPLARFNLINHRL